MTEQYVLIFHINIICYYILLQVVTKNWHCLNIFALIKESNPPINIL